MILEAACSTCGETFNPADETDTIHIARSDGAECGGQGVILGEWLTFAEYAESLAAQGKRARSFTAEARILLGMFGSIPADDWRAWRKAELCPWR